MTQDELLDEIGNPARVLFVGGPRTGKTTLALELSQRHSRTVRCTDALLGTFDWSGCSAEAATWITADGEWIIEGAATARALRKWLDQNPGVALDATIVLTGQPFVELTKGQAAMNKGVSTVWNGIVIEVLKRGARVINAASPKPLRRESEATSAAAAQ
jgi:hypothetical protein